jgi:hypothetical protein
MDLWNETRCAAASLHRTGEGRASRSLLESAFIRVYLRFNCLEDTYKNNHTMKTHRILQGCTAALALFATAYAAGAAERIETTGTPGSPSATTTISGKQLPPPDPKFGGVIKDGALQSKAWWAPRIVPPKEAPNVLLIITDDSGFGVPSASGGVIPTPAMDRVAKNGLLYNNIHSTALLADTRRAHYRAQPSLGGLRRGLRAIHRLPRLQQHHRQRQGHHRPHSAR